jgi:hypothetical protein
MCTAIMAVVHGVATDGVTKELEWRVSIGSRIACGF